MIDLSAFTLSSVLNIGTASQITGSTINNNVISEPNYRPTGSLRVNISWLESKTRSGQKYHIVNHQTNILEERLDIIKSNFSLSEDELSQSLGVTRKTLFNWKNQDSTPSKAKSMKIFQLYILAKNWSENRFSSNPSDLNHPVLGGESIKDMLLAEELDSEKILFAGNRVAHKSLGETELF